MNKNESFLTLNVDNILSSVEKIRIAQIDNKIINFKQNSKFNIRRIQILIKEIDGEYLPIC